MKEVALFVVSLWMLGLEANESVRLNTPDEDVDGAEEKRDVRRVEETDRKSGSNFVVKLSVGSDSVAILQSAAATAVDGSDGGRSP